MQLQLLGTAGCHLCELADAILTSAKIEYDITTDYIDIAEQTQWQALYATRIPVLRHPVTQKELGWPFDIATVLTFISETITND